MKLTIGAKKKKKQKKKSNKGGVKTEEAQKIFFLSVSERTAGVSVYKLAVRGEIK